MENNEQTQQQATDDVWKQLDSEIAGVSSQEGELGDTHEQNESEQQGGTTDEQPAGDSRAESAGETADTDTKGGPDDGSGREPRSEREDNAEVDYKLEIEIPMPYGMEKMTVGAMKDAVSEMHLRQERLDKQSNEVMVERGELSAIVEQIEPYLNPDALQAIQQRRQTVLHRENQRMLDAIPEWKDATVFQTDRKGMKALAGEYGFSQREFDSLADHRLVKMVKDYTQLRSRIEKAKETAKPISKGKTTKPGHKPAKSSDSAKLVENAKASNDQKVKDAAISKLIEDS